MNDILVILLQIFVPLALIILGLVAGSMFEEKHFQSIRRREKETIKLPVTTLAQIGLNKPIRKSYMVQGSVVVSVDYFKRFIAMLVNIFGGAVITYESLLDRARREAILRMKEKCPAADIVINLRVETSSIARHNYNAKGGVACVEVIAYGTAVQYA